VISLLVIVTALLGVNLYVLADGRVATRLPFAVALIALGAALLGPFAGVLRVPLPGQFLLLWLLIIPIAVICAVAATLLGLIAQAGQAFGGAAPRRHRWAWMALPVALIVVMAAQELRAPLRLLRAPVQGIETSTGVVVGDTRYGASFTGAVNGAISGTLSASIDYRPAYPRPGSANSVVGGSWSLAVYRGGRYQGLLYGHAGAGGVRWNLDVTEARVDAVLRIAGGTGAYLGARGQVHFTGNLLHLTYPPTVAGDIAIEVK
jgi:hypothetical protein